MKENFITLLRQLKPEEWDKKVNDKWTVREIVAHMVAWERDDPEIIKKSWETKEKPWFVNNNSEDDNKFNKKALEYYRSFSPKQLIDEWEFHQKKVKETITEIGEDNLKHYPECFGWLFDDSKDSHYNHHYNQIKKIVDDRIPETKNSNFVFLITLPNWQVQMLESELKNNNIDFRIVVHGSNLPWNYGGGPPVPGPVSADIMVSKDKINESKKILDSLNLSEIQILDKRKIPHWFKWAITTILILAAIGFGGGLYMIIKGIFL